MFYLNCINERTHTEREHIDRIIRCAVEIEAVNFLIRYLVQ